MTELHHSVNLAEINPFREVYNGTRKTRTPELICLADVAPRSVGWLWSLRVSLGMLTLISSGPECGKTYLALSIAPALSGTASGSTHSYLLVSRESYRRIHSATIRRSQRRPFAFLYSTERFVGRHRKSGIRRP